MKTISYIIMSLLLFFTPINGLLIAVGTAIVLDTITGIYKSAKKSGWRSIRSRRLSNIVSKMLLYEICILLLFILDKYLIGEFVKVHFSIEFAFTKVCAILLVLIEMTSIKENLEEAFNVDFWKMLKTIIKRKDEIKNS